MSFLFTPQQCFYFGVILFAVVGFALGWRRQLIATAFIVTGVLFLLIGFGNGLATFFFVRFPVIMQEAMGNSVPQTPPPPSNFDVFLTTLITFAVFIALGYLVGSRVKDNPTPTGRFIGIIPGVISGFVVIYYINHVFSNAPFITVGVNTPSQNVLSSSILVIFLILVGALIAGLVASRAKKSGGK